MKKKSLIKSLFGWETVRNNFSMTASAIRGLFPSKKERIVETFDEALIRLGIDPENCSDFLSKKYSELRYAALVCFGLTLASLLSFLYFCVMGFSLNIKLAALLLFVVNLVFFIQPSFRAYQVRGRELYPFLHFVKRPKEWLPSKKVFS